jgi:hypothetical protein
MVGKKDLIAIGVASFLVSVTGFILDLNERIPDIKTNVFEILMMTGLTYCVISIIYFPFKILTNKSGKHKT